VAKGKVVDLDGRLGVLRGTPQETAGGQVVLELPSGKSCSVPVELLKATEGGYRIALRFRDLEQGVESDAEEPLVIPILEERAEIHKRKSAAGKVRIQKVVREHKQTIDEPLMHEEVEIRRIPVNRMVEEPPTTRLRGGTLVVPVLEEVLVVEKRLMLKEEIEIVKKRITRQEPQEVRLRSEEVVVTRLEHGEEP
jgi:uncharacterized protein (TIGR02271 family)